MEIKKEDLESASRQVILFRVLQGILVLRRPVASWFSWCMRLVA